MCTNSTVIDGRRVFNPIAKPWQILKCKQLKLNLTQVLKFKGKGKFLSEPVDIKYILGDGNCLYRSLSYWITGTEDNHKEIRKRIAEVRNLCTFIIELGIPIKTVFLLTIFFFNFL